MYINEALCCIRLSLSSYGGIRGDLEGQHFFYLLSLLLIFGKSGRQLLFAYLFCSSGPNHLIQKGGFEDPPSIDSIQYGQQ